MADDQWITVDLGTLFPNRAAEFAALSSQLNKLKKEADKVILSFDTKAGAATQGLEVTSNLLKQITATGFNTLFMPPKSQPFFTRLANSDNKPVADDFSAGLCVFFQAPSLSLTIKRYTALLDIIAS